MNRTIKAVAGGTMLVLSAATLGALLAAPTWMPAPVTLHPDTMCPVDKPITGHVVLLVDRTDALAPAHLDILRRVTTRVRRELAVHQRLSIHLLTADPATAGVPAFSLCFPGDGTAVDRLTGNPRRVRERFEAGFGAPLEQVLTSLAEPQSSVRSPIIESLATLATVTAFDPGIRPRRLFLVSDLLEHVPPAYSHYREKDRRDVDEVARSKAGTKLMNAGLAGVQIEIVYLRNTTHAHRQGPDHLAFWEKLLERAGLQVVHSPETTLAVASAP